MVYEKAYSGLEAAIVLIAFVVVAAMFAFVLMGVGILNGEPVEGKIVDKHITHNRNGWIQYYHLKVKDSSGHVIDKMVGQDTYYSFEVGDSVTFK